MSWNSRPLRTAIGLVVGVAVVASIAHAVSDGRVQGPASVSDVAVRGGSPSEPPSTVLPPASAGPLSAPHPTIENISILWSTVGDTDNDSRVTIRYRQFGTSTWNAALPLRLVPGGSNEGHSWPNRHAGSLFGLAPGTTYEIEASFTDPDGTSDTRVIAATTRTVPTAAAGATVKPANPSTLSSVLSSAQPGDIVELAAGTYAGFNVDRSGQAGRPIVVRGAPGATVDGEIGIFQQSFVHIDNLTVDGRIRFNGSDHMAITRNTVNAQADLSGHGIITFLPAADSYIADNTVNGLTVWRESSLGVGGDNQGEGILVTGPGHVIEHNRVRGVRDGISFLEDSEAVDQFSLDVMYNDVSEAADDGIEADFCEHNCRIIGNRITNSFIALSSQPSLGGPTYFVRNAVYNASHVAFKLYRASQGDVIAHNTVVKSGDAFGVYAGRTVSELYMRNNVFIGGPTGTFGGYSSGSGRVLDVADLDVGSADSDYNGYGSTLGTFDGRFGSIRFDSLAEMRATTSERHATQVGLDVFASPVVLPENAMTLFAPPDLRIGGTSVAVDRGVRLPNLNDNSSGTAPDLGAFELGSTVPIYGPR